MASIPSQGTVPNPHHVDEEHQPKEEAEEADPEEQAVALILLGEALSESLRPHRRTSACRKRSSGKVGPDRSSAEAPTRPSLIRRASYAGSQDISHEIVLTAATREDLVQQSDRNVL